jgi:hypothetical protein
VIHVAVPDHRKSVVFSDEEGPDSADSDEQAYNAPILAEDEVRKVPSPYDSQPAVEPPPERRGSAFEIDQPTSRPSSRPASIYKELTIEQRQNTLEDVEEYEPLFPEEGKAAAAKEAPKPTASSPEAHKQRFPSRDIWEDAPDSAHYTADVSTPDISEDTSKQISAPPAFVPRDGETAAQAFARHQEELAEKEGQSRGSQKPIWTQHLAPADSSRPKIKPRFPSRDVWEDTPDSLQLETTVSTPQQDKDTGSPVETRPDVPQRPAKKSVDAAEKPSVPERPKPKQTPSQENVAKAAPLIPDRPKLTVPSRPAKSGPASGGLEPADAAASPRAKPAVPARPMGSKIAALQAGFMSDLNKKLGLGPQAPKKEEPAAEEAAAEEKEKVPLSDARKGRARGPQRRAPAKSPSPAAALAEEPPKFSLAISVPYTVFEIDPDAGHVSVGGSVPEPAPEPKIETEEATAPEEPVDGETKASAMNTAGEPVVEETLEKDQETQTEEPTEVEEH